MDKWLWSVRLYKTRTLAAQACNLGRVQIAGQRVKPSRTVNVGDVISAVTGAITRTIKVTALLDQRVGAKMVSHYLEDLTPASEYEKAEKAREEKHLSPPLFDHPHSRRRPRRNRVPPGMPADRWPESDAGH